MSVLSVVMLLLFELRIEMVEIGKIKKKDHGKHLPTAANTFISTVKQFASPFHHLNKLSLCFY